jgi:PIN domain nuclease of toxin-antitoxin system
VKLLLDSHTLLWWLMGSSRLSRAARRAISDPENAIFVSAVTVWELRLKQSLGKLTLPPDFDESLEREEFSQLPLLSAHTKALASLPWHHRDPFDRALIAQCLSEDLRLVTADKTLRNYGDAILAV